MPYVISEPRSVRGCYDTWAECQAALAGVRGPRRLMKVESVEECEEILQGGVIMAPGLYAFTDGSGLGGVGVAIVRMDQGDDAEPKVIEKVATSSARVLERIPLLSTPAERVAQAAKLRNGLSEMAALYVALEILPKGSEATIVHDNRGVEAFARTEGAWRPSNPTIQGVVKAILELLKRNELQLAFKHQRSHRSNWAGRHDYVQFNQLADRLALQGEK